METVANIGVVNTSVATSQGAKAPDVATALSGAASTSSDQTSGRPPYISPAIRLDYMTQQVVLEYRDSSTGEVTKQIPSESQMGAYNRASESGVEARPSDSSDSESSNSFSASADTGSALDVNREDVVSVAGDANSGNVVASAPEVNVENRTQSSQSLGPDVPLGDGDTSSF